MIEIETLRIAMSGRPDPAEAVEVCVRAFDPNAPEGSPAKGGTSHTLYFRDRASATVTTIKRAMGALEKDGEGNNIPGSSPRDKLIAWVKRNRTAAPQDLTPKKKEDRKLESVAE